MSTIDRLLVSAPPIPHTFVVREADAADLETVVAMRMQLLQVEACSPLFARPRHDAEEQAREYTRAHLASRTDVIFLAMLPDAPIGVLRCSISRGARLVRPARYGFITSVFVEPAHRQRGVLSALIRAAEVWCRSRGLREIRLHCTLENAAGNASWAALGYDVVEVVRRRTLLQE